jgi:hypothetical protein
MEILNENIPYYLIKLFLNENFDEIFLEKKILRKKFLNEFIYILINILHLQTFDFKIEGFKIFLNDKFLRKISEIFLKLFDDELILTQNIFIFFGNFLIELDNENKKFVFDTIGFNKIINKFSEIIFKFGLDYSSFSQSSFSISISLKRIYLFYMDYLIFLSNFLNIYIQNEKDNSFKNNVDIKKIILQVFYIIKYNNNIELKSNSKSESKGNLNNIFNYNNNNNMLLNPFVDNINTDIYLYNNINNFNENYNYNNNKKQDYEHEHKQDQNQDQEFEKEFSYSNKNLKRKILINSLSIISYFSLEFTIFQIENDLIYILKLISKEIKDLYQIKQILIIFKRISKLETNLLKNFLTEEIFNFVEEFYFIINNFYNTKNKNKDLEFYTQVEKLNLNEILKSLFFYYSNIIYVNEKFQINFIFDENKFLFILSLLSDKEIITKEVKYEIFYVFYNLFSMNIIRYKSFLAKKNIFTYLINFFKENFNSTKNKLRINCNILCLSFIEIFLDFGDNLTSSFNTYKFEIERENVTDLIEQLQDDENIFVNELAERIYSNYIRFDDNL